MVYKMFLHIVMSNAKKSIKENMPKFQLAREGHRSQEGIFLLKSLMALKEKYNDVMICQFMDLETFFDKEVLKDVLVEASNAS